MSNCARLAATKNVAGYFMVIRKLTATGAFYAKVVRPLASLLLRRIPKVGRFLG